MGGGDGPARPDRRLGHPGRTRPRHLDDPPRHARDVGDVPAARAARDHRGAGRRHVGGRVELGLGAGVVRGTSTRPTASTFPPLGERFDRLDEQLEIITGLWSTTVGETFDSPGGHYPVVASPGAAQARAVTGADHHRWRRGEADARAGRSLSPPSSTRRSRPDEFFTTQCDRVAGGLRIHRPGPATMMFSAALIVCGGADEAEVIRRAAAIGRRARGTPRERRRRHARRGRRHTAGMGRGRRRADLPAGDGSRRPRPPGPHRPEVAPNLA